MKRLLCLMIVLLLCCGYASAAGTEDFIRLHVMAESDEPDAQALKMAIRDTCLACARVCIGDAADADTAYELLNRHLDDFQEACVERARELGYEGGIHVETGRFTFPDRLYGKLLVPAGEYRALRVVIGAGEGHNWWCVLYPSLCVLNEADYAADKPCYSVVFNWLKSWIGGIK